MQYPAFRSRPNDAQAFFLNMGAYLNAQGCCLA